ncbi:MAG: hypothetical protein HPY53_13950, partial [Brevinematales bacterium]|nr:hypothetical protein [Brevinematales bacterium]
TFALNSAECLVRCDIVFLLLYFTISTAKFHLNCLSSFWGALYYIDALSGRIQVFKVYDKDSEEVKSIVKDLSNIKMKINLEYKQSEKKMETNYVFLYDSSLKKMQIEKNLDYPPEKTSEGIRHEAATDTPNPPQET